MDAVEDNGTYDAPCGSAQPRPPSLFGRHRANGVVRWHKKGDIMMGLKISNAALLAILSSVWCAAAAPRLQIEIQGELISFPKAEIDKLANAKPNWMPGVEELSKLRQSCPPEVVFAPRLITPSCQEAVVKSVREVIYPTDFAITAGKVPLAPPGNGVMPFFVR